VARPAEGNRDRKEIGVTTSQGETGFRRDEAGPGPWTVGADDLVPCDWSGETVHMPTGRLHAVSGEGLVAGRAVCLAPVVRLDPLDWCWPDDGSEEWPLCWICLAFTH
jgi:hypothetical protein